jgi:HEAT repeat protein
MLVRLFSIRLQKKSIHGLFHSCQPKSLISVGSIIQMLMIPALLFTAVPAYAQSQLKKLVLENCNEAEKQLGQLKAEDRAEFISYLVRVMKMKTSVPGELLPDTGLPNIGSNLEGIRGGGIWHIFEPSREKEAKQCAAKLAAQIPGAVTAIPSMIEAVQDETDSAELREDIQQAAWTIVLNVEQDAAADVDEKTLAALIDQLDKPSARYFARNVLVELHAKSLPRLLRELNSPDPRRRDEIDNVLLLIDSSGGLIGPAILDLLNSGDDELRQHASKLLSNLDGFYQISLPILIGKLDDPSPNVENAVFHALAVIFSEPHRLSGIVLTDELLKRLLREFQKPDREHRDVLERGLRGLAPAVPESLPQLLSLADSEDDDLRLRALRIVIQLDKPSDEVVNTVIQALYDRSLAVRLTALQGLGANSYRFEDKASALVRILKSNSAERDPSIRQIVILQASATVSRLPVNQSIVRLIPYFIDALSFHDTVRQLSAAGEDVPVLSAHVAIDALRHIGKEAINPCLKALKDDDPLTRRRAIEVLGSVAAGEASVARQVVDMLKDADPQVRGAALDALPKMTVDISDEVRKGLVWKNAEQQSAAARLMLKLGVSDPRIADILRDNFARAACSGKLALVDDLVRVDQEYRSKVQPFLLECLRDESVDPLQVFATLQNLLPLQRSVAEQMLKVLQERPFARNIELRLIEKANTLGIDKKALSALLLELLDERDNSVKNHVLQILGEVGPGAKDAVPALKTLAENQDAEPILRDRAMLALVQIDPTAENTVEFFEKQFESEDFEQVISALGESSADVAVPILGGVLKTLPPERKASAVKLIGKFGTKAKVLSDEVSALLHSDDPKLRYRTTVALLKMEADPAVVEPALRRELLGKFGRELLEEKLPQSVKPVLENIIQQPASFVEGRAAAELLAQINHSA